MEAIAELIGALFVAVMELALVVVELFAHLLALIVEFVFLALTRGTSTASQRFHKRRDDRRESRAQSKLEKETEVAPAKQRMSSMITGIVVVGFLIGTVTWIVRDKIRRTRMARTIVQIEELADGFIAQIKDAEAEEPQAGPLADRDAWDRPIELSVDKALLGSMIVVRSHGPDRKAGTADDLLATRVARASVKEVGGELADRGVQAMKERLKGMLPKKQEADEELESDQ